MKIVAYEAYIGEEKTKIFNPSQLRIKTLCGYFDRMRVKFVRM
jgi:hypothetical protein